MIFPNIIPDLIEHLEIDIMLFENEWNAIIHKIYDSSISIELINVPILSNYQIILFNRHGEKHLIKDGIFNNNNIIIGLQLGDNFLEITVTFNTRKILLHPNITTLEPSHSNILQTNNCLYTSELCICNYNSEQPNYCILCPPGLCRCISISM